MACERTFLRSGSFEMASYNLAPSSHISLACALWDLRLATLAGRVKAAASSSSVALEWEAWVGTGVPCRVGM